MSIHPKQTGFQAGHAASGAVRDPGNRSVLSGREDDRPMHNVPENLNARDIPFPKDLVSIRDLSHSQILSILKLAAELKQTPSLTKPLADKIIASCFFEPSTRTRLSFESAALRLGAQIIGFSSETTTSVAKGESLSDSIRVISNYADLLVIRHKHAGAARRAAEVSTKPIINAGDGCNQHPTQALIDLFTLKECQFELKNLSIAFVGDLKYNRAIHSLIHLCAVFKMRIFLIAPRELALPEFMCDELKIQSVPFSHHQSLKEIISKLDVIYMTRLQRERNPHYKPFINEAPFILGPDLLKNAPDHLKILHPLPRTTEIDPAIDSLKQAHYFSQAANAIYVRQALLMLWLEPKI